jgi:hypothetical protein
MLLGDISVPSQKFRVGMWAVIVENLLTRLDRPQTSNGKAFFFVVDVCLCPLVMLNAHGIYIR